MTGSLSFGDGAHEETERALGGHPEGGMSALIVNLRTEHYAQVRRVRERELHVGDAELRELSVGDPSRAGTPRP